MNVWSLLQTCGQDIVHSLRALRKKPIFAATVIFTLVLAIGGNATMFTIIRAVLLKPLEYHDPDHLVYLSLDNAREHKQELAFTLLRYEQTRAANKCFTAVGAFLRTPENMVLAEPGNPEVLKAARVSANFLHILGIRPVIGREFAADEDVTGGPAVVMISTELWRDHFGGDSQIIGKHIVLDDMSYTIVGVLPQGVAFPFSGLDVDPTQMANAVRSQVLAVDPDQAVSELKTMDDVLGTTLDQQRLTVWLLVRFAGIALLLAVIGLYGVLGYSVEQRIQELGVRRALGAEQRHILTLIVGRALWLTCSGTITGVFGALALAHSMQALLFHVSTTDPVTFVVIFLVFVAALVSSSVPAWRAACVDPLVALRGA